MKKRLQNKNESFKCITITRFLDCPQVSLYDCGNQNCIEGHMSMHFHMYSNNSNLLATHF